MRLTKKKLIELLKKGEKVFFISSTNLYGIVTLDNINAFNLSKWNLKAYNSPVGRFYLMYGTK